MADVKWIKLTTDMFDNRKIKHLRRLPEGNSIVLIWVMLLTMAGRCNAGGMIFLTENIPYTPKMLADELDFEETTVELALRALEQFDMIVCNNGYFTIAGWEEHQNVDGLEKIREQNRLRKQKQRENQKLLENVSRDVTGQVTQCHATEEEKEREEDKEIDIRDRERIDYRQIVSLYNEICVSLPSVRSLTASRQKAIRARLNTYTVEQFEEMFRKAESSSFLKGAGGRNWIANFDWLIKDSNFAKVLEGNYDDKGSSGNKGSFETDDFFNAALKRSLTPRESLEREAAARMESARDVRTAASDPETLRRAEELKAKLQGS